MMFAALEAAWDSLDKSGGIEKTVPLPPVLIPGTPLYIMGSESFKFECVGFAENNEPIISITFSLTAEVVWKAGTKNNGLMPEKPKLKDRLKSENSTTKSPK